MSVFYLVRHAHADWTPDENRPLSARGHIGSDRVSDVLHQFPITAIYSSPARRAHQTVAPLATQLGLPIHTVSELRERQLGAAVVQKLQELYPNGHLALATHGTLLALLLHCFDSSVNFTFWKSMTMPDIYKLSVSTNDEAAIQRIWQ